MTLPSLRSWLVGRASKVASLGPPMSAIQLLVHRSRTQRGQQRDASQHMASVESSKLVTCALARMTQWAFVIQMLHVDAWLTRYPVALCCCAWQNLSRQHGSGPSGTRLRSSPACHGRTTDKGITTARLGCRRLWFSSSSTTNGLRARGGI